MVACDRICCAIDFSEASLLALVEAAELARWLGAELTILHVHAVPEDGVGPRRSAFAVASVDLHRDIAVWRAEAERRAGAPVHAEVEPGDPGEEIRRYARERRAGLLVLGARGRSAPGGRRLGLAGGAGGARGEVPGPRHPAACARAGVERGASRRVTSGRAGRSPRTARARNRPYRQAPLRAYTSASGTSSR